MEKSQAEILEEFLLNASCLDDLNEYTNKVNLFDILKSTRTEIRHSNILAWLLDANSNHKQGSLFIADFIKEVISESKDTDNELYASEWSFIDYSNERVIREYHKNKNNSLDILILIPDSRSGNNYLIAIENKIDSSESENQTKKYADLLDIEFSGENCKKAYVYLSPKESDPPEDERWISVSYDSVYKIICRICNKLNSDRSSDTTVGILLNNYKEILEREIAMDEANNREVLELCNKIYNKYKDALDLIYDNIQTGDYFGAKYVIKALNKLKDENKVKYIDAFNSGNTYIRFATPYLDEILPENNSKENGMWSKAELKNRRYIYEIHTRSLKTHSDKKVLPIYLTLTLQNADEKEEICNKIMNCLDEKKIDKINKKMHNKSNVKTVQLDVERKLFDDKIIEQIIDGAVGNENAVVDELASKIEEYINKHEKEFKKTLCED